MNNTLFMAI